MEPFRGQRIMVTCVIEVPDFNSRAICGLRDCMEASMASEATKMVVIGIMHMDTRVQLLKKRPW